MDQAGEVDQMTYGEPAVPQAHRTTRLLSVERLRDDELQAGRVDEGHAEAIDDDVLVWLVRVERRLQDRRGTNVEFAVNGKYHARSEVRDLDFEIVDLHRYLEAKRL